MNVFLRVLERMKNAEWQAFCKRRRARLRNTGFSILAANCIGGIMYHDLGLEFLTPTVNLTIPLEDLIKLAGNLRWYMEQSFVEIPEPGPCPAGMLGDVRVNFVHYASFREGVQKWEERKRKSNWDKMILIATDRGISDSEVLERFDRLEYPYKILFTHVPHPELGCAVYMPGFEDREEVGVLTNFRPGILRRRYLDGFDYVGFLNRVR